MAKSEVYINKIESCRERSITGFRLKQIFYNAIISCNREGSKFKYLNMLEKYCIPTSEHYIDDKKYYRIIGDEIVQSIRTKKETEILMEKLAAHVSGRVVYSRDGDPMLLLDNFVLRAFALKEDTFFTDEYEENFDTPYDLFPRIINIKDGKVLIEVEKGKCIWKSLENGDLRLE